MFFSIETMKNQYTIQEYTTKISRICNQFKVMTIWSLSPPNLPNYESMNNILDLKHSTFGYKQKKIKLKCKL